MLFSQAKSGKEVLEIFNIQLPFSSLVNYPQQTSNFLHRQFFTSIAHESNQVLSSDKLPVSTEKREDMRRIKVKRTQQSSVGLHESKLVNLYLLYWVMIYENSLVVIHSIFESSGSPATGISTGLRMVKYRSLGFWLGNMKF